MKRYHGNTVRCDTRSREEGEARIRRIGEVGGIRKEKRMKQKVEESVLDTILIAPLQFFLGDKWSTTKQK